MEISPRCQNERLIEIFNTLLTKEFEVAQTYMLRSEACANIGLEKLSAHFEKESQEEWGHARKLAKRMYYLGIDPQTVDFEIEDPTTPIAENVKTLCSTDDSVEARWIAEWMVSDHHLETSVAKLLQEAIELARTEDRDEGSAQVFAEILADEEEHIDWLEAQIISINSMGMPLYWKDWR